LSFAQIAVVELEPKHMRGYGAVPKPAAAELNRIVSDLQKQIADLARHVDLGIQGARGEQPRER
jgi:hypothetical protein